MCSMATRAVAMIGGLDASGTEGADRWQHQQQHQTLKETMRIRGYPYDSNDSLTTSRSSTSVALLHSGTMDDDDDDDDDDYGHNDDSDTVYLTSWSSRSQSSENGLLASAGASFKGQRPTQRPLDSVVVNIDGAPGQRDRLIDTLEALRSALTENTNAQRGNRDGRKQPGHWKCRKGQGQKVDGPNGTAKTNAGSPVALGRPNGVMGPIKEEKVTRGRKERVIIELRVVFLKIGEIDTLKEQYSADTYIQAKWREPSLDGKAQEELKKMDISRYWNPLLYIDNILSETKEATWLTAAVNHRSEAYVYERRRVRGVFMENLELNDFPLDVQDLTVTITSERPDTEIDIIPDEEEMSGINIQTFVDQQEWKLHEHIEVSRKLMTQEFSSSNRSHPALSVTCRAARRPGYFYWNVFLVMFFISALSFATFAVAPDLPQNRLQLSFTLLLTSVAFKFVINQSLPKISYLTYMDKYVLLSLVILCVVCIWHAVVTVFIKYGISFMIEMERDVFIAFGVIYIICHLVFVFWLYFDACKRRRLMNRKDKEYREFLARKKEWLERTKDFVPSSRRQSTHLLHSVHAI